MDFICPPGGALDEAIARQAMLDAISDFADAGMNDFGAMSDAERREFFLDFIIRSIEGRIITDMATRGMARSASVEAMEDMQEQLHDFVAGHTRGALAPLLDGPVHSDAEMMNTIDNIYEAGFELISLMGEAE
nr:Qat anti-phage system associated protein QatB [Rhodobacter capsulatus]